MTTTSIPSSHLLDLVISLNWDHVKQYILKCPQDASFQDGDGLETPLFLAIQFSAPLSIVNLLLEAHPEGATTSCTRKHTIPLHIACRFGAPVEILQRLVQDHPETVARQNKWGETPLTTLVRHFKEEEDASGEEGLWNKIRVLLSAVAKSRNLWEQEAGPHASQSANNKNLLLLHAAVSLGSYACPAKALDMVLQRYGTQQVMMRDSEGRLPLHLALYPTEWTFKRKYKPRELHAITTLLQLYPQAALIPFQGRLPLHMAVSNGHSWQQGVKELFYAHPNAIRQRDDGPTKGLLPFMLASIPEGQAQPSLDTIYMLLLMDPVVLEPYIVHIRKRRRPRSLNTHSRYWSTVAATTLIVTGIIAMQVSRRY